MTLKDELMKGGESRREGIDVGRYVPLLHGSFLPPPSPGSVVEVNAMIWGKRDRLEGSDVRSDRRLVIGHELR